MNRNEKISLLNNLQRGNINALKLLPNLNGLTCGELNFILKAKAKSRDSLTGEEILILQAISKKIKWI